MDEMEKNDAPQEVVLWYVPQPRGIEEYYVQPTPLPGAARFAAGAGADGLCRARRRRRGLRVFLACVAALGVLAAAGFGIRWWQMRNDAPYYDDWYMNWEDEDEETTIARYPNGEDVRLVYTESHGEELTAEEIYARVNPSTVLVLTQLNYGSAVGTGVIMTENGYVLTNAHVISGGKSVTVALADGQSYDAKLVGFDEEQDLAVLKVDAIGLPAAEFGSSDSLNVGETVYAIGNPLGVELRGTFTDGILSAINRDVEINGVTVTLLQTNAALNSGNSGGPLINRYGQVVGINTLKMDSPRYSADSATVEGLGFAIPISSAAWMVDDLIADGEIGTELTIGIMVLRAARTMPDGRSALEVSEVTAGSSGDLAGIQAGDWIVTADGEDLSSTSDLLRVRRRHRAGEALHLEVWRDGKLFETDVTLVRR